jgi:hypothetical protein
MPQTRGLTVLITLLVVLPALSYAFASLLPSTIDTPPEEPKILGTFTAVIEAKDVKDLWAWQVLVSFNPDELKYLNWRCGETIKAEPPFQITNPQIDIAKGRLLIGATLKADEPGVNIEGIKALAYITFGYYTENYTAPRLIIESNEPFKTILLDSKLQEIPITEETLNIKVLP